MRKLFALAISALFILGACTKDGGNLDGRWIGLRAEDTPDDVAFTLDFSGNKLDMYVIAWGQRYSGTYTLSDGVVKFNINKVYQAFSGVVIDENTGEFTRYSWTAGDMDGKTLELVAGYEWYEMNGGGDWDRTDKEMFSTFEFKVNGNKAKSNLPPFNPTFTKIK
jgi:hypothetical protein